MSAMRNARGSAPEGAGDKRIVSPRLRPCASASWREMRTVGNGCCANVVGAINATMSRTPVQAHDRATLGLEGRDNGAVVARTNVAQHGARGCTIRERAA